MAWLLPSTPTSPPPSAGTGNTTPGQTKARLEHLIPAAQFTRCSHVALDVSQNCVCPSCWIRPHSAALVRFDTLLIYAHQHWDNCSDSVNDYALTRHVRRLLLQAYASMAPPDAPSIGQACLMLSASDLAHQAIAIPKKRLISAQDFCPATRL